MAPYTIVAIDDDRELLGLIQECLEAEGFRVFAGDSAAKGLAAIRSLVPDLVLCDVNMPGADGHTVLANLRQSPATAAVPFLFLTGDGERSAVRRGMEAGADDYITKPFMARDLVAAVRAQLEKREVARRRSEQALDGLRSSITRIFHHELLTPLTPIVTYAELLRAGHLEATELATLADGLGAAAQTLQRTVHRVLFYAVLEILSNNAADAARMRKARTESVGATIAKAAGGVAARSGRMEDLRFAVEDGPVVIPVDCLEAIVEELTDNACKFSPPGTPIDVRLERGPRFVALSVADQGPGMAAEHVRLIGAYMQFDRQRFEQDGTGLGLVIVRRVADLVGGYFTLRSVEGQGTAGEVYLPIAVPALVATDAKTTEMTA